jgi:hypothetical protein
VVVAVNPLQASRYRERHGVSGAKSDRGDAHMLTDMVRTDSHQLRVVAGDSADAGAVKVVARAHKMLIWERTRQVQRLRYQLREYFPAALDAFADLDAPDALELLAKAPDPARAAKLTRAQVSAALKRARRRDITGKATEILAALRSAQLGQPPAITAAYAVTAWSGFAPGEGTPNSSASSGSLNSSRVVPSIWVISRPNAVPSGPAGMSSRAASCLNMARAGASPDRPAPSSRRGRPAPECRDLRVQCPLLLVRMLRGGRRGDRPVCQQRLRQALAPQVSQPVLVLPQARAGRHPGSQARIIAGSGRDRDGHGKIRRQRGSCGWRSWIRHLTS